MDVSQVKRQLIIITLLYSVQGVPQGLAELIPILMVATRRPYSEVAVFATAYYPYTLKILWSPLVDAIYSARVGQRRSWVLPSQALIGCLLIFLGLPARVSPINIEGLIESGHTGILTGAFFLLFFAATTQDIALDAWSLSLLPDSKRHLASACQTVGTNIGKAFGFNLVIALSSNEIDFPRLVSLLLPLKISLIFFAIGAGVLAINLYVLLRVPERGSLDVLESAKTSTAASEVESVAFLKAGAKKKISQNKLGVLDSYMAIPAMAKNETIRTFAILVLTSVFPFGSNIVLEKLSLVKAGVVKKETFALLHLIVAPLAVAVSIPLMNAKGGEFLLSWLRIFYLKTFFSVQLMLANIAMTTSLLSGVVAPVSARRLYYVFHVLFHVLDTLMFILFFSFSSQICDESYGGTYLTFLAVVYNFGHVWVKILLLAINDRLDQWFSGSQLNGYALTSFVCSAGAIVWIARMTKVVKSLASAPRREWFITRDRSD